MEKKVGKGKGSFFEGVRFAGLSRMRRNGKPYLTPIRHKGKRYDAWTLRLNTTGDTVFADRSLLDAFELDGSLDSKERDRVDWFVSPGELVDDGIDAFLTAYLAG